VFGPSVLPIDPTESDTSDTKEILEKNVGRSRLDGFKDA
jgi:hypothetical protein